MCSNTYNSKHMYQKFFILTLLFLQSDNKQVDDPDRTINLADCGVSYKLDGIERRIVGGSKAYITQYPWIVSFQKRLSPYRPTTPFCGGSIINRRWILSASHCFNGVKRSIGKVRVVAGTTQWNGTNGDSYQVDKLFLHDGYDEFNYANDIALIKTKTPIEFRKQLNQFHVNSICLANPTDPLPKSATVYGWGLLGEFSTSSIYLMKATLYRVNQTKCNLAYEKYIGQMTEQMMCYSAPGKDACQGDSGGPLSQRKNNQEYQIGIVSSGLGCGRSENPGIYTNIKLYEDWIKKTIESN